MKFDVVTLFPELVTGTLDHGVTGRALRVGQLELACWNPRDYSTDKHRTVDDRPYGGGPGMVMKVEPLRAAIRAAKAGAAKKTPVVYVSPQGRPLDQAGVAELASQPGLILVAGRYEGIDERLMPDMDREISIGDYVLSGGELAVAVVM
ncbi:MAG TPA: tRNA (guanosine(37)-N1)-methyltransferase TrmD, partial [Gammaproteobacteria bacterium]|nr:tRNA (guanosine(37)-N1)-methyltransferase TrmD [Gammaproteobacteria bacterium]